MKRYQVVEARVWEHESGRRASIYGACPWTSDAEKPQWKLVTTGYTVRDNVANTVGFGRPPHKTRKEAQAFAERLYSFGPAVNGEVTWHTSIDAAHHYAQLKGTQ